MGRQTLNALFLAATVVAGSVVRLAGQAQPEQTPPAFDIADVHVRPPSRAVSPQMSGGVLRAGRYDLRSATMLDLISVAYDVDADRVPSGPSWLERDRFDIAAQAPNTTPPATVRLMMQRLLADRFSLVLHPDTRPMPGFALVLEKGTSRLRAASGQGRGGCAIQPRSPEASAVGTQTFFCRNVTMDTFARELRDMAGTYVTHPIQNRTGLAGAWDFDLTFTNQQRVAQAGADAITIVAAVDRQLGLMLTSDTAPTQVLVVDRVNERPTDNPADVARRLPSALPAEFEVADIKPSAPDARQRLRMQPGGRLDVDGLTLKELITLAWDIPDELLAGEPPWLTETRFSILAKISTDARAADALSVDFDDVRAMLRALLVTRFKLVAHTENRPVDAYTLLAVKPKLQRADPSTRTRWREGPGPDGKDPRLASPILSRLIACQNMTMAQLAEDLPRFAGVYFHTPVEDATGLDGAYDFTLSFTPLVQLQMTGRSDGAQSAGVPQAAVPLGALSIFDAVSKQLGVKLELRKRPMPVLVIDHVERPTPD